MGGAWSHHEPKRKYALDENGEPDKNIGNICSWPPYKRHLPPDPKLWRCKRAGAFLWGRTYRFWCTIDRTWAANTLSVLECPPPYFYLDIPYHRRDGVPRDAYRTNSVNNDPFKGDLFIHIPQMLSLRSVGIRTLVATIHHALSLQCQLWHWQLWSLTLLSRGKDCVIFAAIEKCGKFIE